MKMTLDQITEIEKNSEVTLYPKRGIALEKGKGIEVFDTNGKKYIDCMTNIGVNILGYGNKTITKAIAEQLELLPSTHQSYYSEPRALFLNEIRQVLPPTLNKIIFTNSGSESVEAAIKLAKAVTGKKGIIAAINSYHGRTLGALSATGQEKYREPFLPLLPYFVHIPFNSVTAIKNALTDDTAAVILEPIQAEGGLIIPDKLYLKQVQKLCREKGVLLIMDEVQTAIRTGTWLTSEQFGVIPDIVCLSKSLSYGLPFGVVVTTSEIAEKMPKGSHGSTFAGNPVACIAATNVITEIKKNNLLENAQTTGAYFLKELQTIKNPVIKDIRGIGLMLCLELTENSTPYVRNLQQLGVLAIPSNETIIRFLPPMTLTKKDVDRIVKIIKHVFT